MTQSVAAFATEEQVLALEDLEQAHRTLARTDPAAFCSYVLRDEETGRPIIPQPMHEEWHDLISNNDRTLIWAHIEAGKSSQISIGRVLFELGKNPDLRVVIVMNTDLQAQKICRTIAKYIESSVELHEVFPHLKPADGYPWNAHQIFVQRKHPSKDPSIATCGVHARGILGSRIDLLVIDDILNYENATSETQRDELWNWYRSTLEGRLTRKAKAICVGTAWHRDDIMHRLASRSTWMAVRYPAINDNGESSWPERWPLERIEKSKINLGIVEYNRQLMCIARSDEEARFKQHWLDMCLHRGNGRRLATNGFPNGLPAGYAAYSGVDLSAGKKNSDLSCIFTIIVHPDESREVANVESGRWTADIIVEKIIQTHRRFGSIIMVEANSVQIFINQFVTRLSAVPIRSYQTSQATFKDPVFGIESMAVEMSNAKWIIPNDNGRVHPEVAAWMNELLYYDPDAHAGDRLMASFFARENTRQKPKKGKIRKLDLVSR